MAAVFKIKSICIGTDLIQVFTDKGERIVGRDKFEKWVDDDAKRLGASWDTYYASPCALDDLYDYLVIRGGSTMFNDIRKGLDRILY